MGTRGGVGGMLMEEAETKKGTDFRVAAAAAAAAAEEEEE